MSDDDSLVAANMKRLRKAAGLSQAELARRMRDAGLDWHQNTVSRVENGTRAVTGYREVRGLLAVLGPEVTLGTEAEDAAGKLSRRMLEFVSIPHLRAAEANLESALREVRGVLYAMGEDVPYDEEGGDGEQVD